MLTHTRTGFLLFLFITAFLLFPGSEFVSAYNEPDNFAGLKFGHDLTKQIRECILLIQTRCYKTVRSPADQNPERDSPSPGDYRLYNMGEFQAAVDEIVADQQDGKLIRVTALVNSDKAQSVLEMLKHRYGKPTQEDSEADGSPVSPNNRTFFWKGQRVSIQFETRVPALQRGRISWTWMESQKGRGRSKAAGKTEHTKKRAAGS